MNFFSNERREEKEKRRSYFVQKSEFGMRLTYAFPMWLCIVYVWCDRDVASQSHLE